MPEGKRHDELRERYGSVGGGRTHRSLSRKDFLRLGGAGVAGLTLFGGVACGGGSEGGGNTLSYWASNQGASIDQDKRVLGRAVKEFKKQSGISVKIKVIPWSDLYNNILTATTSGQGPDVLNIGNTWSASLQATGAFLPFDGEMLDKIGGKSKFLSSSFAASGAPGETPTSTDSPTVCSTTRSSFRRRASPLLRRPGTSSSQRRRNLPGHRTVGVWHSKGLA